MGTFCIDAEGRVRTVTSEQELAMQSTMMDVPLSLNHLLERAG
jgi:hypothetical protein